MYSLCLWHCTNLIHYCSESMLIHCQWMIFQDTMGTVKHGQTKLRACGEAKRELSKVLCFENYLVRRTINMSLLLDQGGFGQSHACII